MATTNPTSARTLNQINALHRGSVDAARRLRHDGAAHARLLDLARVSRVNLAQLRARGA